MLIWIPEESTHFQDVIRVTSYVLFFAALTTSIILGLIL